MNILESEIDAISSLALETMQAVLAENEKTRRFEENDSGPLALASALSDFFQIAAALEASEQQFESGQISELGEYGLDLMDRLSFQNLSLELMTQRPTIARIFASLGVWLARREAELDNMAGIADGFGQLANGTNNTTELATLCQLMEEVIEAVSEQQSMDQDRGDPSRPWRVINLNQGIVATRSLDAQLMERTFERLEQRLPEDMPVFFTDGARRMVGQNVPEEISRLMQQYADKWQGRRH
jgi:hypothetical protein